MTSRERVLAAIAHKATDKVPVDLGATPSSTMSAIAYSNLLKYIGREDLPVRIYDVVQQLAKPDMSILEKFGVDVLDMGTPYDNEDSFWQPTVLANGDKAFYPKYFNPVEQPDGSFSTFDETGTITIARMPQGATFFDQAHFPYLDGFPASYPNIGEDMSMSSWGRYPFAPFDHAGEEDFWKKLRENAIALKETGKATIIGVGCNLFEWGTFLRRLDNFLMDLYLYPDEVERLLDALLEHHMKTLEKVCDAVGDVVDMIKFGDDLGTTNGPFFGPETYQQFFKPRHKQMCDYVKSHSKMHTYLHSCGSIYKLMPDLIEAGFEIINPVQTNARDMDPRRLKAEFGKDVTFWGGGIENVGVLNGDDKVKIREQVLERLEIMSEGGGYVFNTVHNILPDCPAENVVAMFDAVNEFNTKMSKEYERTL